MLACSRWRAGRRCRLYCPPMPMSVQHALPSQRSQGDMLLFTTIQTHDYGYGRVVKQLVDEVLSVTIPR
jgi:hypothetical protein